MELSNEALLRGLRHGRMISPMMLDEYLIENALDIVREQQMSVSTDTKDVSSIREILSGQIDFLKLEIKSGIQNSNIFVLPLPHCIAFTDYIDDKNCICLSQGLIDLVAAVLHMPQILPMLPDHIKDEQLLREMTVSECLVNALFILLLRFYRFGEPLPNIRAVLPEDVLPDIDLSISGAIAFIILHEYAHAALGHLEDDAPQSSVNVQITPIIQEEFNRYQKEELEADQFALNSLLSEAVELGGLWRKQALTFFSWLELITGHHSSESHPAAINRSQNTFNNPAEHFEESRKYSPGGVNPLTETSRENCIGILDRVNLELSGAVDLSPIWRTEAGNYLDLIQ